MPTPPKPHLVLASEKKSHRTKAELKLRKQGEKSLLTGVYMEAWQTLDAKAKKEFNRIKELLAKIGKDDALYQGAVNRYCQLKSECEKYEGTVKKLAKSLFEADKKYKDGEIDFLAFSSLQNKYASAINATDRQLQAKRKMMLDLEKENCMTIASALRAIPKKVEKKEKSGIAAYREKRAGR